MHFPVSILINVQIYGKIVKVATIEVVVGRMALNDHNLYHNYTYIYIERIRAVVSRMISVKVKPTYDFASIEIIDEKEKNVIYEIRLEKTRQLHDLSSYQDFNKQFSKRG